MTAPLGGTEGSEALSQAAYSGAVAALGLRALHDSGLLLCTCLVWHRLL